MREVNIVGKYKLWYSISAIIMIIGIVMILFNGLNLGIDFTGGTMMQIDLGQTVSVDDIKTLLEPFDLNSEIVHSGSEKESIIIKTRASLSNEKRTEIFNVFKNEFTLEDTAFVSAEQFGPSIGNEIRNRAIMAVVIASIFMLIYITFRFEFAYGLAAIIALVHDVLILVSIYAIFRLSVNSSFIAAILTIVGYSINDTIVVFDRLRENVRRVKGKAPSELADLSISQSLTRSINTSLTTLLVLLSLVIFGSDSIREFAIPLATGIAVGTYSSIFIASPTWVLIKRRKAPQKSYASK